MQIIKYPQENVIEATCPECNTLFSYTRQDVEIVEYEEEAGIANYRRTGFLKGEYFVNTYRHTKPVIACPYCEHIINVPGRPGKDFTTEKIGERVLTKQEIKDWQYALY